MSHPFHPPGALFLRLALFGLVLLQRFGRSCGILAAVCVAQEDNRV